VGNVNLNAVWMVKLILCDLDLFPSTVIVYVMLV
jgi:hypothetical protein